MRRPLEHALALLVLSMPIACGPSESDDDAESGDQAIRDGESETGYASVGMFTLKNGAICTGTLIAPDVVLTAAHCLRHGLPEAFYTGNGKASTQLGTVTRSMTKHGVEKAESVPGYVFSEECPQPTLDLGLVKLAAPVAGVDLSRASARAPAASESCTAVGFGFQGTSRGKPIVGEKRSAQVKFVAESPLMFDFEDATGGTEGGDSGGPLFCAEAILGVNSCGNAPDRFARIDVAMPWIDQKVLDWDAKWLGGPVGEPTSSEEGVASGDP